MASTLRFTRAGSNRIKWTTLATALADIGDGAWTVVVVGKQASVPFMGKVPLPDARSAIESSLNRFARVSAYENWLAKAEERALAEAICVGDRLPSPAPLTLDDLLPFTAPEFD